MRLGSGPREKQHGGVRREKETKQNKTQAEEHSILLPVAVFTRGCFTLWISIRATSHATLSWDGAGECLRYRRSATFPLPTDACTRLCLPSSPTKLQGHLWQPQTGHLVPPSSPQPPCQITLIPCFENTGWITPGEG